MAVLKALMVTVVIAMSFAIACYSPDAPDCALSCTADSDCISGQACTTDHLCAATGITTCGAMARIDGGGTIVDAPPGTTVKLMVHVDKGGGVKLSTNEFCDTGVNTMATDCMFDVAKDQQLTLTAYAHLGYTFDKWGGPLCMTQMSNAACVVTPTMDSMANAGFKND
ncbi:MAG: hypothetical protein QM831_01005 [Kofleriaceae bacterium]